jgi:hypothetical protein
MNRDPQGAAKNLQAGNSPTFFPAPLPANATHHRAADANRESAVYTARVRSASWRGELEQTLARQQRHGKGSNTAKRQPGLVTAKAAIFTGAVGAHGTPVPQSPALALGFRA